MALKQTTIADRIYLTVNEIALIVLAAVMIYPLLNTLAISLSSGAAAEAGRVTLWPVGFQLVGWEYVAADSTLHRAFLNSVYVTVLGTFSSLAFTALLAYPMSKKYFRLRGPLSVLVIFIMIFRFPLIPYFLAVRAYGLLDNIHVLIITSLLSAYNLIIMRTFFQNLPDELEDSAIIDGANHFQILLRIVVPLSKPVFATLGLFFAVGYWNQFLQPLLFIQNPDLLPIQVRLRQFISMSATIEQEFLGAQSQTDLNRTTIEAAVVIFGTIPILMLYPFLQKYFVKGALLGSLKG
jgi:putative aldouronate transport system permease protein